MSISRRTAIAAVSLLSVVSLAACGGGASNSSTGAASGAASAGAEKATGKVTVLAAASLQGAFSTARTSRGWTPVRTQGTGNQGINDVTPSQGA